MSKSLPASFHIKEILRNNRFRLLLPLLFLFCTNLVNAQKDSANGMRYIDNGIIRLGIDLNLGGAITYLSEKGKPNMINNWDWGRQIQMSFYSGPVPYEPEGKKPHKGWTFIGWNPIQSGDVAGNRSRVTEFKRTGNSLYVRCIPMHWPLDNVPGTCTYECRIQLEGNTVKVRSRMVNQRPDHTQYPARGQELPAVYTNAPYHQLVTYTGAEPYTHDTLSIIKNHNLPQNPSIRWAAWQATENWAACVNEDGYGLGIWNEGVQRFSGGYYGDSSFKGGSHDISTGYIAPNSIDILDHNITYDYHYVLIVGTLDAIRNYACKQLPTALPGFHFRNSRLQWYYENTKDRGWPIRGCLEITLNRNAAMISPLIFWKATDASRLLVDAQWPASVKKARIYFSRFSGSAFEDYLDVDVQPGRRQYILPLASIAHYKGAFNGVKILPDPDGKSQEQDLLKVYAIRLLK
ncbi:hypothetical protein [Niabella sp.]|uniref:hypothetical protein n=1 Tax=Niabella sp. TaxID=1962976 RepID=UPI002633FB38|nr:hypothetical protein [Niabella sp.]